MNKNSNPMQKLFPWVLAGEHSAPTHFFKLLEFFDTSQVRKHIFELQVNIDKHKANSRRYDVTR